MSYGWQDVAVWLVACLALVYVVRKLTGSRFWRLRRQARPDVPLDRLVRRRRRPATSASAEEGPKGASRRS